MSSPIVVSNVSDASFAIGVAHASLQPYDIADMISLKSFVNSEFCPRFMQDDVSELNLGHGLDGKSVYIISTHSPHLSRNELAMRNFLIASAAKENGAKFVALVEPDLYYSAQDRGPRTLDHPQVTDFASREKFVGQPCSAELYANLLKNSGVDAVMTVHNHKPDVMKGIYEKVYGPSDETGCLLSSTSIFLPSLPITSFAQDWYDFGIMENMLVLLHPMMVPRNSFRG